MAVTRAKTTGGKDYAAIARAKIHKPRGIERPSILVYARNKKGKTRFTATAPNVLILDPEGGAESFTRSAPDLYPITRWQDLDEAYQFLRRSDHKYEWVGVDGLTKISNMALRFVMEQAEEFDIGRKPGMVQQRDYGKAGELVKGLIYNLQALDVGVVYSAQERQVDGSFEDEDEDVESTPIQYVPDLPKGVRATVNASVDVIGRLYTVPVERDNGTKATQRRLWVGTSTIYDTGARSEYKLPEYIPAPTVPKLVNLINGKVTK